MHMMHACMIKKIRNDMLCSKIPDRLWLNAYTMNLEEQWKKESHFQSQIQFFLFANFLVESHYFDHLSFKHTFFVKENIFFIFNNTFLFPTCHIFFTIFRLTLKNIFFLSKKTNTTLIFSIFCFLFKIKHYPISRKE